MHSSCKQVKMQCVVQGDRLSILPDDLIHKILSFVSIKDAIRTCILSSRWRFVWTSMPYLNFSSEASFPWYGSPTYVINVLSRLNKQIQVYSVKLVHGSIVTHDLVKRVVSYAVSHNVQQLTITCYLDRTKFPLSVFSSKSLKHLTFGGAHYASSCSVSPTWELPALTTLHLDHITFSDDERCIGLFSKCTNLKDLSLSRCKIEGTNVFNIFHPTLSNLTLGDTFRCAEVFNVVTPQLKNLTIRYCYGKHLISAPSLTSLVLKGDHRLQLSTEGFPVLNKVDLSICQPVAHKVVSLLQQLHTLKFLTLNFEVLEVLSLSTKLISHQPCEFPNLKISKFSTIHMGKVLLEVATQEKVTRTTESKDHDNSPSAIFKMVSFEEMKVMRDMVSTQKLIEEIRVLVKLCEANSDHMTGRKRKRDKVQVKKQWSQSAFEMQWHFGEMMTQIEQGIIDGLLTKRLPTVETCRMISWLQSTAKLVTELPASRRTALQAALSKLCEEAAILMNNMMDGMKKPVILRSSRARKPKQNQDSSFIYE